MQPTDAPQTAALMQFMAERIADRIHEELPMALGTHARATAPPARLFLDDGLE